MVFILLAKLLILLKKNYIRMINWTLNWTTINLTLNWTTINWKLNSTTTNTRDTSSEKDFQSAEVRPLDGVCPGKEETIEHVCNLTSKARQDVWLERVTLSMMVSHPDVCRRILTYKYGVLRLPRKKGRTSKWNTE